MKRLVQDCELYEIIEYRDDAVYKTKLVEIQAFPMGEAPDTHKTFEKDGRKFYWQSVAKPLYYKEVD